MHLYCPLQFSRRGNHCMQALIRIHFKTEGQPNSQERWQSVAAITAFLAAGGTVEPVILSDAVRHTAEEDAA